MNDEEIRTLQAAVEAVKSAADEANTVAYYAERLIAMNAASPEAAQEAKPQFYEVIKDELNHLLRFVLNIFVPLTGIEPDTDGLGDET